jgi:hypothetical protein
VNTVNTLESGACVITLGSVADPDQDEWDRFQILALIDDPILTFLVCLKALDTQGINVALIFGSRLYFLEHISAKNIFRRNLAEIFFLCQDPDVFEKPDPVKNRPDPQH